MSWSLGEIQALTVKAARGAGHPWGIADEAGWAVRWLSSLGLPGPEAMAEVLDNPGDGTCPLRLGIAMADAQQPELAHGLNIRQPLILLPFLGRAVDTRQANVRCGEAAFQVTQDRTDLSSALPTQGQLSFSITGRSLPDVPRHYRIAAITEEALETLQTLAHMTYAPATEASRISGAGAGLTDND